MSQISLTIPKSLPKNWAWSTIGEFTESTFGQSPPSSSFNYEKNGLPFFQGRADFGELFPEIKVWCNDPIRLAKKNDVLVCVRAGVGGTNLNSEDSCIGRGIAALSTLCDVDPFYVLYYFRSIEYYLSHSGSGNTITGIKTDELKDLPIPVAPLKEQNRLIKKISQLLEETKSIQIILDDIQIQLNTIRKSIWKSACIGDLTIDWRKKNPTVETGEKLLERIRSTIEKKYEIDCKQAKLEKKRKPKKPEFKNNSEINSTNLPKLPVSWKWSYFQNMGDLSRGKSKHRPRNDPKLFGGKYPFIQTGEVARSNGTITSYSQTYNEFGLSQSKLFPKNTLCITIAANIADSGILTFPSCFPDSVVGFTSIPNTIESLYGLYFMNTIKSDLKSFAPETAQKNINLDILGDVIFPVPPYLEQVEITKRVEDYFKLLNEYEKILQILKKQLTDLPKTILRNSFAGNLSTQKSDDGTAEELLERIRKQKS